MKNMRATADLTTSFFFQIPFSLHRQDLFCLQGTDGHIYQLTALPMRLCSSPELGYTATRAGHSEFVATPIRPPFMVLVVAHTGYRKH